MREFSILSTLMITLAITAGLFGCATTGGSHAAATSSLADTNWELVAIQSMNDAQGTTRIASPERITASFAADGHVSFRLDCNRGTATWESVPGANGTTGTLQFGPIAATRAMCPPPHLDERVVRNLAYVRSYLRQDGKPFMSLMADGGIYEWRSAKQ
jgi:heat shock protein HslJ